VDSVQGAYGRDQCVKKALHAAPESPHLSDVTKLMSRYPVNIAPGLGTKQPGPSSQLSELSEFSEL